jgi:hypothetical protein
MAARDEPAPRRELLIVAPDDTTSRFGQFLSSSSPRTALSRRDKPIATFRPIYARHEPSIQAWKRARGAQFPGGTHVTPLSRAFVPPWASLRRNRGAATSRPADWLREAAPSCGRPRRAAGGRMGRPNAAEPLRERLALIPAERACRDGQADDEPAGEDRGIEGERGDLRGVDHALAKPVAEIGQRQ